ncbi:cysteine proteinase [Meira miltonrushii]|uniref:Ubiquitin carboxyl-terminal hydrolase n=1 Tax=Meira miltonrushii TaxID=1280837 RepID=A0A316VIK5_9BASI|nr:cysteine proteinase [Meira miltonrushii]PWN35841.1 cysteine proteinase [Meira miltonrushii]
MGHMHNDGITTNNGIAGSSEHKNGYSNRQVEEKDESDSTISAPNSQKETIDSTTSANGKSWRSTLEESTIARVQNFIIETLNKPVKFIVSHQNATQELPYKPINDPSVLAERKKDTATATSSPSVKQTKGDSSNGKKDDIMFNVVDNRSSSNLNGSPSTSSSPAKKSTDLFPYKIALHPPKSMKEKGNGLFNKGNTCYMNSTLQALLHLPPLANALLMLDPDQLYGRLGGKPAQRFDAIGEMVNLAKRTISRSGNDNPTSPNAFIHNLKLYAPTLTKYHQEDAQEFLRFLLDAMQYCNLIRASKILKPFDPLRETTLVHKIFGGKLRSRVTCERCNHNSDTYDTFLDLSLDIRKSHNSNIASALEHFTSTDHLNGTEKYRCEKCKMSVNATKRFTIHQAPPVLTIHFKRFTQTSQKINKQIGFGEELNLNKNVLSEGQPMQKYKLHSIIHHHGSGPNSGHYVASVRGSSGKRWYEMNDSSVHPLRGAPVNSSSAYVLFYVRAPGNALDHALHQTVAPSKSKKRRIEDDEEDEDEGSPLPRSPALADSSKMNGSSTFVYRQNGSSSAGPSKVSQDDDDDDDIGEAVGNVSAQSSNEYESLAGPSTPLHQAPMSKKQRRRMKLSQSNGGTREKARSSLVSSPFMASKNGNNRSHNGKLGGGHRAEGGGFANRMKDKHGRRPGG